MSILSLSSAVACLVLAPLSKAMPRPGDAGTDVYNLASRGFRTPSPVGADADEAIFDPTYPVSTILFRFPCSI